ncbi:MAG: tyrosine-type recombinase/integrase, partial [Oscillospiraceae bacterium]|nr:tyrosine-type recombinase/integrase [Oscillospiraceae bacterium]
SRDITAKWRCEITAHYLRHDYATRLYEAGIDIPTAMRLLGHADYNTTVKVYTHISKEKLRQAGQSVESARVKKIVARKLPKSRSTRTARKANPPKT